MAIRTFLTDRGDTGHRLDLVLRRRLAGIVTRTRIQEWIESGAVTVDGRPVRRVAARVGPLARLNVDVPDSVMAQPRQIEQEDGALDILFEDDSFMAVNKSAGLVVHPTHAHPRGTLLNALAGHARGWPVPQRPSIVGRLDKLTSGIVLVAKTAAVHAALQRRLREKVATKDYLAVVYGRVRDKTGRIDIALGRDLHDRRRVSPSADGAFSRTEFDRLVQIAAPDAGVALLRCRLITGRTHQIRAHLLACGWPIVGDPVYGEPRWRTVGDSALAETLRTFPRQALHAWRLAFTHPVTTARIEIDAPLPSDVRGLLSAVGLTQDRTGCNVSRLP